MGHQRTSKGHPAELPAGQVRRLLAGKLLKPDGGNCLRGVSRRCAVHGSEIPDVRFDAEVSINARALGDVSDVVPERCAACRLAEDGNGSPPSDSLDADDCPHERRFAAAGRAQKPCDATGVNREVQASQDLGA